MLTIRSLKNKIADLPQVQKYFKSLTYEKVGRSHGFVITQVYKCEYITRYYMARFEGRNNDQAHLLEYLRKSESGLSVCRNLYFTPIGGYQVKFPYMRPPYSGHDTKYGLESWGKTSSTNHNVSADLTNYEELIKNDPSLKYLKFDRTVTFLELVKLYRDYPDVELLAKNNLSWICQWSRVLKLKDEYKKRFFKYLIKNKKRIIDQRYFLKFNDLYFAAIPEMKTKSIELKKKRKDAMEKRKLEMLSMQNLKLAEITLPINQKDFSYKFELPKTVQEIISVGEELRHCYKNNNTLKTYLEKHINGTALLVFIKDKESEDPIAAAEVDKNGNIVQLRAKNNESVTDDVVVNELHSLVSQITKVANTINKGENANARS